MMPANEERTPNDSRGFRLAAALVLVALILLHAWRYGDQGADDAFISFRYAYNWNLGHGLVWNPGERVEGYSNFLFTVVDALLVRAVGFVLGGRSATELQWAYYGCALALNAAALLAAQQCLVRRVRALHPRWASPAAFLFALTPAMWHWAAMALEAPVVMALQLWGLTLTQELLDGCRRRRTRTGLFVVVAMLVFTRADGFLSPLFFSLLLLIGGRRRTAVSLFAWTLALWASHAALRLSYYGFVFPNTVYAKVSGPLGSRMLHGLKDLLEYSYSKFLACCVVLLGIWTWQEVRRSRAPLALAGMRWAKVPVEFSFAALLCAYYIFIGADVFEERFLIVLYPSAIVAAAAITASSPPRRGYTRFLVPSALALLLVGPLLSDPRYRLNSRRADHWLALGEAMRPGALCAPISASDPDRTLAIDAAGKVPFISGLPAHDILGLNDVVLAHMPVTEFRVGHNKYNANYTLSRHPRFIAAWVHGEDLNFNWGLTRAKWTAAGYRPQCLVNMRDRQHVDIRSVDMLHDDAISDLVRHGFEYGVLMRHAEAKP